jgi:hypothetical protein
MLGYATARAVYEGHDLRDTTRYTFERQTFTFGENGDDIVSIDPFTIDLLSSGFSERTEESAESLNTPLLSVTFSSVPEPGTLLLIGVVLLAVALRAAQCKFRRATSPV